MLTNRSTDDLRAEAKAHEAEAEKLRMRADAVHVSGAPSRYGDVLELYEELSAEADAEFNLAMKLYRRAHATDQFEREQATKAA